jgi:hypothetical protein
MKRFLPAVVAISSVLALVAAAQAGDRHHQGHSDNQQKQQQQYRFGSWGGVSQIVSDFKKHHDHKHEPKKDPIPIDPGRGDGRVPVGPAPVTTPPARPGFVWVDGHWEREKAPPKVANPYSPGVEVRDHRTPAGNASGGTIIRDHRTPSDWAPAGTTVRDHRTPTSSNAPGGTVVVTSPLPRNDGVIIRDHRTTPVIRDHRTTPVVRDHRTGQ